MTIETMSAEPVTGQHLDIIPLADLDGEPRARDVDIAERLGFERPDRIKALVERHTEALERFGEVVTTVVKTSARGGRPGKNYWLNKKQALYLCTKSEAPAAAEVTIQMVEVFDAWQRGHFAQPNVGAEYVEKLVAEIVDRRIAADPRVAVLNFVSVRQILDEEHKVPAKGRRSLQRKVFLRLSRFCLENGIKAFRNAHSGTWLFPPHEASAFTRKFCADLIGDHLDKLASLRGQGRLHLVVPKTA